MFVCYNHADKFLHLYIENHVSQTFINSSKTLFYYGGTLTSFGALIWCLIFRGREREANVREYSVSQ